MFVMLWVWERHIKLFTIKNG